MEEGSQVWWRLSDAISDVSVGFSQSVLSCAACCHCVCVCPSGHQCSGLLPQKQGGTQVGGHFAHRSVRSLLALLNMLMWRQLRSGSEQGHTQQTPPHSSCRLARIGAI
jgi:hypothetical protein